MDLNEIASVGILISSARRRSTAEWTPVPPIEAQDGRAIFKHLVEADEARVRPWQ